MRSSAFTVYYKLEEPGSEMLKLGKTTPYSSKYVVRVPDHNCFLPPYRHVQTECFVFEMKMLSFTHVLLVHFYSLVLEVSQHGKADDFRQNFASIVY